MSEVVDAFLRANPSASVEELSLQFPHIDIWDLREARRDARRAVATASGSSTLDLGTDAALSTLPPATRAALRAGFFEPVRITWTPTKRVKPIFTTPGRKVVQFPDIHAPEHDPHALDVAIQVAQAVGPHAIVLSGDQFDCNSISKYTPVAHRPLRWVEERAQALPVFIELRATFPNTEIVWLYGNHDIRPETFISSQAQALQGLFTLEQILGIEDLNFVFPTDNRLVLAGGQLIIKHGTVVSQEAGASVAKEVRKAGTSVGMGHVHRLAYYAASRTAQRINDEQPLIGVEAGCLQRLDPSYLAPEDTANWQQGIVVWTIFDDDTFAPELVPIFNGQAFFRGMRFTSRLPR